MRPDRGRVEDRLVAGIESRIQVAGSPACGARRVELQVLGRTWRTSGLSLWACTSALSMLLVVIVAPVLGAVADLSRGKKRFLAFCVFGGSIATAGFSLVTKGDYLLCAGLVVVANFLWSAGNIFYDGFRPELTEDPRRMDAISAAGCGVGYLGGGLALLVSAALIFAHEPLGLGEADATGSARLAILFLITIFVLGILVLLAVRPEKGREEARTFHAPGPRV